MPPSLNLKPIFPIWVEPETDPGSQCRDYNTLRPPRVYCVEMFGYCLPRSHDFWVAAGEVGGKGDGHELSVHLGRTRDGLLAFLLEQLGFEEGRHLGAIATVTAVTERDPEYVAEVTREPTGQGRAALGDERLSVLVLPEADGGRIAAGPIDVGFLLHREISQKVIGNEFHQTTVFGTAEGSRRFDQPTRRRHCS